MKQQRKAKIEMEGSEYLESSSEKYPNPEQSITSIKRKSSTHQGVMEFTLPTTMYGDCE